MSPDAGKPPIAVTPSAKVLPPSPGVLRYDLRYDIPLVLVGYVAWTTLEELRKDLAPRRCVLCDHHLNGFDEFGRNALKWQNATLADTLSNITGNALTPAGSVGTLALAAAIDDKFAQTPIDAILVAQAVAFSQAANLTLKYSLPRLRPYARDESRSQQAADRDANVSFYSGHASYAFSLAVASGTVASMRGYSEAGWVWITGVSMATMTAYLRVAADKHYLTDVLSGAAMGSTFGFLFPYLLHRPVHAPLQLVPTLEKTSHSVTLSVGAAFLEGV